MKSNLKKSFIWNTLGSGLNAFTSLFFLIIATRINGEIEAGIFTLCFTTAGLMYIIGTYSGRTYQVTEQDNNTGDKEFIASRIITVIIMLIVSILISLISGYNAFKIKILITLCILKALEALCDVFHGIMQKNDRLDLVGKSMFIRSILNICLFLIVDLKTKKLLPSCLSLVLVDILVLLFIDIRLSKKYKEKKKDINYKGALNILKLGFYTFGFTLLSNYLISIPRYAIDSFLEESYQTIFGIIVMPGTFITLLSQFIIQPLIIKLKDYWSKKDKDSFNNIVVKTTLAITGIGILSLIGAYFLGVPVLNLLYGLTLDKYLLSLLIILLGTTFYALSAFLSNCLIVFRKTKIQLIIYLFVAIFGIIISRILVNSYSFNGGVYSYLIIMLTLFIIYILAFIFINKNIDWKGSKKDARKN